MNSREALAAAWQAALRGDMAEKSRLCEEAKQLCLQEEAEAKREAEAKLLAVDFYVTKDGRAISSRVLYAAAH